MSWLIKQSNGYTDVYYIFHTVCKMRFHGGRVSFQLFPLHCRDCGLYLPAEIITQAALLDSWYSKVLNSKELTTRP